MFALIYTSRNGVHSLAGIFKKNEKAQAALIEKTTKHLRGHFFEMGPMEAVEYCKLPTGVNLEVGKYEILAGRK